MSVDRLSRIGGTRSTGCVTASKDLGDTPGTVAVEACNCTISNDNPGPGDRVEVSVDVTNVSDVDYNQWNLSGSVTFRWHSLDGMTGGGDTFNGDIFKLSPGETQTFTGTFNYDYVFDKLNGPGDLDVAITVDAVRDAAAGKAQLDCGTVTLQEGGDRGAVGTTGLVDCEATQTISPGDTFRPSATIANEGEEDFGDGFQVFLGWFAGGARLGVITVSVDRNITRTFTSAIDYSEIVSKVGGAGEYTVTLKGVGGSEGEYGPWECGTLTVSEADDEIDPSLVGVTACSVNKDGQELRDGESTNVSATVRNDNDDPVQTTVQWQANNQVLANKSGKVAANSTTTFTEAIAFSDFESAGIDGSVDIIATSTGAAKASSFLKRMLR